jgi:hypothetical protein
LLSELKKFMEGRYKWSDVEGRTIYAEWEREAFLCCCCYLVIVMTENDSQDNCVCVFVRSEELKWASREVFGLCWQFNFS